MDVSQQSKRKEALQKIVNTMKRIDQIDKIDMDTIIIPNICIITQFYSIPSGLCSNGDTQLVPDNLPVELGKKSSSLLSIVLIVLGILVAVFVILVVIFAVRARMAQAREEEIGEELPGEPTPAATPAPSDDVAATPTPPTPTPDEEIPSV